MQDDQLKLANDAQAITTFTQQLLVSLESALQHSYEPDWTTFRRILLSLPQEYQAIGREAISERVVNDIKLHFLETIARFYEKAELEGIEIEDRDETLRDIRPLTLNLMRINSWLSVKSLENLIDLSNITAGLRTLSKVDTAERAQRWVYKIPALYQQRLEQEGLISQDIKFTVTISVDRDWFVHRAWNIASKVPKASLPWDVEVPQIKRLQEQQHSIEVWRGKLSVPHGQAQLGISGAQQPLVEK